MRRETIAWLKAEGARAAAGARAAIAKAVAETPQLDDEVYGEWEDARKIVAGAFSKVMKS